MNNIISSSNRTNKTVTLIVGLVIGVCLSAIVYYIVSSQTTHDMTVDNSVNTPLYWVAPMDPNFKRDKPGKSPMGMDLVPVFDNQSQTHSSGTISIDPVTIQNLGVKTAIIQQVTPVKTINTFGQVHYAQDKISHVHPRVAGWVEKLYVRAQGDTIAQGEPLYDLYSPELVNAQEEFIIALEQNNQALIRASQTRLIALNAPFTLVKSLRENRKITRTITFNAPQSGVINELNIQEGFYVTPNKTMLSIAAIDMVWILADIFTFDINQITLGQSVHILFDALPGITIHAKIDYIYPDLHTIKRTATARLVVANPKGLLKPEMYAEVRILNNNQDPSSQYQHDGLDNPKIVAVPHQAIIRTGQQNRVVLALGEGKYKSVEVRLGERYDTGFAVLEGLKVGDEVVISAQFLLDSESNITSDFMRMENPTDAAMNDTVIADGVLGDNGSEDNEDKVSAWTRATVNDVMLSERMVNLTHGSLDAFDMMGMTMNFMVSDNINIADFEEGIQVHVEIIKGSTGMYEVNTVHFQTMNMDDAIEGNKQ